MNEVVDQRVNIVTLSYDRNIRHLEHNSVKPLRYAHCLSQTSLHLLAPVTIRTGNSVLPVYILTVLPPVTKEMFLYYLPFLQANSRTRPQKKDRPTPWVMNLQVSVQMSVMHWRNRVRTLRPIPTDVNEGFPSFLQSPTSNSGITSVNTVRLLALLSISHPITLHRSPSHYMLDSPEAECRHILKT